MSSGREEKFEKYFKQKTVETKIKTKNNNAAKIYNDKGTVVESLPNNYPITVPSAGKYSQKYFILYEKNGKKLSGYISESQVAKPINPKKGGATEILGIQSNTLITQGKSYTFDYNGLDVLGFGFTSASQLSKSILTNLKANPNVNRDNSGIIEAFESYFKSQDPTKIQWNSEIQNNEINELGKYMGELLLGYIALKKPSSLSFINGKPTEFFVPNDPSFKGVDTFLFTSTNLYPISNKYGVGAKASFFGNLLPVALNKYSNLPQPSVIKSICDTAKSLTITSNDLLANKGAKKIVYEFGIRKILKLNKETIPDTYGVYTDIRKSQGNTKKMTKESLIVIEAIKNYTGLDSKVKSGLPMSITAFFNRTIVSMLNSDTKSINFMLDILAGKKFYQANLNIDKWKSGVIEYRLTESGDASIQIIAGKAAITDIESSQGLINYELKIKSN